MSTSSVATFDDPYPYQTSVRAGEAELVVTSRGEFQAELTRIDLHRLWMQRSRDNLPRIVRTSLASDRAAIFFLADAHQRPLKHSGTELSPGEIIFYSQGAIHHQQTSAPCQLAYMSLSHEELAKAGRALLGHDLSAPAVTRLVRPAPARVARLTKLHETAGHLAKTAPDILAHPEVARAMGDALVHAMIMCLTDGTSVEMSRTNYRHLSAMIRFEEFLTANPDRALYLTEICTAIGVSERNLEAFCRKHLGIGPVRYLWLRRMHLARRALARSDPSTTSVTAIATRYGFWELGRFSVAYGALFQEPPSVTLRQQHVRA